MSASVTAGFYIYSDTERQRPGYLRNEAADQKKTFWTMGVHTGFLKITIFSTRVGSMGSMEARGSLPLPCGNQFYVGRGNGCTLAHNDNLHNRGWAPGAGDAEDGGGAAATGELPWAGQGFSKHLLWFHFVRCSMQTTTSSSSFRRLCRTFWPLSCPL